MRLVICAALATLAHAVVAPLPAVAAEKAIWGPTDLPSGRSAFPVYRDLGVDTYQAQVDWATIAPRRPAQPRNRNDRAYRWPTHIDRAIAESRRNGIRVALLVSRSPSWANGGRGPVWVPRTSAFADFVAAASRRYPSVRRWMIWGEPNSVNTFRPNRGGSPVGPRAYARILDAAYSALKRVSRRNIVIGGMTHTGGTVRPAHFLRLMRLPSGRRPRLDWFGHNPFPIGFPDLRKRPEPGGFRDISDLDTFTKEIARAYTHPCGQQRTRRCGRRPKLWLSEFLVQSDHPSRVFARSVSRTQQARWLQAAYDIADQLPSVAGLGWLSLFDEQKSPRSANWGLLTASGRRKPSFFAYRRAPSRAFRPDVSAPRWLSRANIARRRSHVRVRPRAGGVATLELRSARGRLIGHAMRKVRAGALWRVRIPAVRLRPGRHTIVVDAPRGERVRRKVIVS
jgi:hypothetical protein